MATILTIIIIIVIILNILGAICSINAMFKALDNGDFLWVFIFVALFIANIACVFINVVNLAVLWH